MKKIKQIVQFITNHLKLIVRGVLYTLTVLNSVCMALGVDLPLENGPVYEIASVVLLIIVFIYAVWHNFSVSKEAQMSDKIMQA